MDIWIAPFRVNSPLKRSVLTRDHTVLPPPTRLSTNAMMIHPAFTPKPQPITALRPVPAVLISHPTEGRRLSWPGWLVTYRDAMPVRRRSQPSQYGTNRPIVRWPGSNSRPLSRKSDALTTILPSHYVHLLSVVPNTITHQLRPNVPNIALLYILNTTGLTHFCPEFLNGDSDYGNRCQAG